MRKTIVKTASLAVNTITCAPSSLKLDPTEVVIKVNDTERRVTWSMESKDFICGAYRLEIEPKYASLVKIVNGLI
jgi:hypothetical protein